MRSSFFLVLILTAFALNGCGKSESGKSSGSAEPSLQPTAVSSETTTAQVAPAAIEPVKSAPSASIIPDRMSVTAPAGSAAAAFQKTLVAFQEGRLDLVYESLPASYQTDVESLVHLFAEKMDADIWTQSFGLAGKLAAVMKSKKELILNFDAFRNHPQVELMKPNWDQFAAGLQEAASSDVANLGYLKQCEVKKLLVSANRAISGVPMPKFGNIDVSSIRQDETSATLSYRELPDGERREVEMSKVDDQWLPKTVASGWADGIAEARKRIDQIPEQIAANKASITKILDSAAKSLERIQQARNADEFAAALPPLMFSVTNATQLAQLALLESSSQTRAGNAVRIEIYFELQDDEQTKLRDAVLAHLGSPDVDYEMLGGNSTTRCRFTPVSDPQALVAVIQKHFAGANVRFNTETKTIHVEMGGGNAAERVESSK